MRFQVSYSHCQSFLLIERVADIRCHVRSNHNSHHPIRTIIIMPMPMLCICDSTNHDEASSLRVLGERRAAREPLQYLLGEWDFMDFTLKVGRGVLCPRADSEVVCETAIELLKDSEAPVVYDLCAGTGCLGLGIARAVPSAKVTCVELSHDAWPYLTANVAGTGVQAVQDDVLTYYNRLPSGGADLIISNPPYLTAEEMAHLMPETAKEPAMALEAGEDGLVFYRALAQHYKNALCPGGALVLEIGWQQREAVTALLAENGWAEIRCIQDFGGNDRCVTARRPK